MSGTAHRAAEPGPKRTGSAPPKTRAGAYPPRAGAGPGRKPRRMHSHGNCRRHVRVVLPDEPPTLNPAAAGALLAILLDAYSAQQGQREGGLPMTERTDSWPAGSDR
jgi:hypothetical protein